LIDIEEVPEVDETKTEEKVAPQDCDAVEEYEKQFYFDVCCLL
jgi:hypothetical protein